MDYLVVFNHQQPHYSDEQIHDTMINLPISDWWHYLPNVYIVSSHLSEKVLADGIIARNPGLLFLIVKVDLSKANGVLNKSAWDWINNKIRSVLRLAPVSAPPPMTLDQTLKIAGQPSSQPQLPSPLADFFKKK